MSDGRLNFKITVDDKDAIDGINRMQKGVNGLTFTKPTESINRLKKEIEEVNEVLNKNRKSLTDLNFKISNTAPGQLKKDLQLERNSLKKSIQEDELALKNLNAELKRTKASHTTVNAELLKTRQQMSALAILGKQNTAEYQQLSAKAKEYSNALKQVGNDTTEVSKRSRGLKGVFTTIASYFGVFAGIQTAISLIRGAFNTIVDFDSRLLNVSKTTGLAGQELKNLGTSLRNLSQELKVISVDKLMEFAGVAGQLGIKGTQEILAFTEALAKLSVTSNIQGEEGAIQIARFLGLVEGDVKNVKDLGDELTNLGNNFKVFEDEIIKNALAIAQNTGTFKLGRQEILAYATSLKEAGVEAELTGASLGRTYQQIEKVLRTGKNIDNLAKITGQSVEDLKSSFDTDPQGVIYSFIKGLNEVQKAGGSVNNAITSIGITATRDLRVIGTLATGGFDVLNRAMNDVTDSSGAMQQEFETASGKISNSIESVKVSWENLILAINSSENTIGNVANAWLSGLAIIIDGINKVTTSWKELNKITGTKVRQEAYEYEKAYLELDFDTNEKRREDALEDRQRYSEELKKINDDIVKNEAKLKEVEENRSFIGSIFMGSRGIKPIQRELDALTKEAEIAEGRILAIDEAFEQFNKKNTTTTTTTDLDLTDDKKTKKSESALKKRLAFLDELQKAENDLTQSTLSGLDLELSKVNEVYNDRLKKAKELGANQEALNKIESLRVRETETVTYKADTEALKISLEQQKKDYEDFENFKKQVGVQKATEMYSDIIDVSKSYYDVLRDELASFGDRDDLTNIEKQRINELFKLLQDYSIDRLSKEKQDLQNLIKETATYQERISLIQETYAQKRKDLEKVTNEQIRNEKLAILNQQEKDAILSVENEVYERQKIERDAIRNLTTYTKKELENRIKSTEEFLIIAGENLSENQRKTLEGELSLLNAINGSTDLIIKQNALLKEKERITKAIKNNTSKDPEIAKKLNKELEDVNELIEGNKKDTISTAEGIQMAVQGANMLASAFGGVNKELQMAVEAISNIVSALASGDMAGAVMAVAGTIIQGAIDVFGKNDTSAINSERLRLQEEYNKMLRDQLLIEIQLNDAYQSRAEAIKEEQEALLENRKVIIDRMKEILNTFYELYKDFGGFGSTNDFDFFVEWQDSGLNEYFENGVELSDELLNKLIELNAKAPLQGQMKDLFDELIRLKEEFGSVNEAVKQLKKEDLNIITGTTAQSLADSIREGIASGKRSFSDFADDIEGFLRNAILAGMSAEIIEPQVQALQDLLAEIVKDGITEEERKRFEEAYAKIAEEAAEYIDLINQAGINLGESPDFGAGAKDGIKRITESQADRLTGILTGMQVDVIESRKSLQLSNNLLSSSLDNLIAIEFNTRATADNTYQLVQILQNNQQQSLGL